ncbi:signal recognition particle subunit SRP72 [Asbolus verrucosus]|uniref:Signal recognition particle subunit SRP72 n=1 Tax=Asbolus verrucosus TaxID=1661398 RepID=A0A482W850_ASBVE|nr:signal recognition particle subunit SRP72 [Asbolus verrucosus]
MSEKAERDKKAITSYYSELNRFGQNGEYERAIKAANKILNLAPHEFLAFQYKVICLIELSKFDEAIRLLNGNAQFDNQLTFEKAYCLYRANKHDESLKIVDQIEDLDLRSKELKAQILYRLERYEEAAALYRDIVKNTDDDYEDERHTNLSAVMVYLDNEQTKDRIEDLRDNTYELCYNKACLLIAHGQYAEAEKKLRQCEKLCREMLEEEEASEEEIDVDLALIRIQLAFVYQKQGRVKEAHQLYTANLKIKLDDAALMAVASNNVVCINKDQNLFDSKKKMKLALNDTLVYKLPSKQRKYIALNNAILNYYIHQTEQCEKICKNIEKTWPELTMFTAILRALNMLKGDDAKEAIALLEKVPVNRKQDELFIKLCIAQLYLVQGDKVEACKILENLGENSYKPGIVGALTTLYLGLGNEEKALRVFERSVDWYKKNKNEEVNLTSMWRQAADFHIRNGHPQVAANSLEELLKSNKGDKKITAQLVLACSQFDKTRALELSKQLPSIDTLSTNIDIESLQLSAPSSLNLKKSPAVKQDSQPGTPKSDGGIDKKKKHKKRKGKLPKNYNSSIPPDPERWLPKYERTGYRKKRDRRAKDVIKGSQGTASGQAEQYDFSSKVAEQEVESPVVEPSPRVKYQQKKGQQKKKNKRR